MRVIVIDEVLDAADRRRKEEKPLPAIERPRKIKSKPSMGEQTTVLIKPSSDPNDILLQSHWDRISDLKVERAMISNEARIRWQQKGDRSTLKELYQRICAKTTEMASVFRTIEQIEKTGDNPEPRVDRNIILQLKDRKKQLINLRDKLRRNLAPNAKQPKDSGRRSYWEEQLSIYDAEFNDISERLTRLR